MRRLPLAAGFVAIAVSLATGSATAATAPPDGDASPDDAVDRFVEFLSVEGYDAVLPSCVESDEALAFVCYALTSDGEPIVAEASLATDAVEWEILVAPDAGPDVAVTTEPQPAEPATSEPVSSEPVSSEPVPSAPVRFDTLSFFHGVFSADADDIEAVLDRTQPGSPAEAYVRFQQLFVEVAATYGNEVEQGSVFLTADGIRVCVTPDTCSEIAGVEVSDDQIVTFEVDGNPIGARLSATGEAVVAATTALRLSVAYQTVTGGQLAAFVEVATEQGDQIDLAGTVYVGPDGSEQPVAPQLSLGLDVAKLKGNHVALLAFPGAMPGGELHITVTPADGSAPAVAVIPVEAITP